MLIVEDAMQKHNTKTQTLIFNKIKKIQLVYSENT